MLEQDCEEEKIRAVEKIDEYWRKQTHSLQNENFRLSELVKELQQNAQYPRLSKEFLKLSEELLSKLVDAILEENKDWLDEGEEIGYHNYYFSVHCVNIDILEQFHYTKEFISQFPELVEYLLAQFKADFDVTIEDDTFWKWFGGGEEWTRYDGFCRHLSDNLVKMYRQRITEHYPCVGCDQMVSEKYGYSHEKHLHRIGRPKKEDKEIYLFDILCKKCNNKRVDAITKPKEKAD